LIRARGLIVCMYIISPGVMDALRRSGVRFSGGAIPRSACRFATFSVFVGIAFERYSLFVGTVKGYPNIFLQDRARDGRHCFGDRCRLFCYGNETTVDNHVCPPSRPNRTTTNGAKRVICSRDNATRTNAIRRAPAKRTEADATPETNTILSASTLQSQFTRKRPPARVRLCYAARVRATNSIRRRHGRHVSKLSCVARTFYPINERWAVNSRSGNIPLLRSRRGPGSRPFRVQFQAVKGSAGLGKGDPRRVRLRRTCFTRSTCT